MAKVKVVIVEQNGEFFVQPAVAVLDTSGTLANTDKLKIFNSTSEDLVVRISNTAVFDTTGTNKSPQLEDVASGASTMRQVAASATLGRYEYEIFMRKSGKKAKGNSDPVIIIDN